MMRFTLASVRCRTVAHAEASIVADTLAFDRLTLAGPWQKSSAHSAHYCPCRSEGAARLGFPGCTVTSFGEAPFKTNTRLMRIRCALSIRMDMAVELPELQCAMEA